MRILYIVHTNKMGGSVVALQNILKYMHKKHDVMVMCPKPVEGVNSFIDFLKQYDIPYNAALFYDAFVYGTDKNVARRFIRTTGRFFRHMRARKAVRTIIESFQPDLVHTNNGVIDIALNYCLKKGIPHVWHLREYQDLDFGMSIMPSKNYWMNRIHKTGNYNIAITKGIFDYFKLRDCDTVIYDGPLKESHNFESKIEKNKKSFLFVAGCISNEGKGLMEALKAFCEFCKTDSRYNFLLVGTIKENDYWKECQGVIAACPKDSVITLGQRDDVYDLMSKAIAIVVPSFFEGFGFITTEAMYNKCLVIGRDTAGTKEQFDNGLRDTGFEIGLRFNTIEQLTDCMHTVVSDNYSQIIETAYTYVQQNYTETISNQKIEKYYKNILKTKQG